MIPLNHIYWATYLSFKHYNSCEKPSNLHIKPLTSLTSQLGIPSWQSLTLAAVHRTAARKPPESGPEDHSNQHHHTKLPPPLLVEPASSWEESASQGASLHPTSPQTRVPPCLPPCTRCLEPATCQSSWCTSRCTGDLTRLQPSHMKLKPGCLTLFMVVFQRLLVCNYK